MKKAFVLGLALSCLSGVALAQEGPDSDVTLKNGAGKEQATQNCSICHSLRYIVQNSPFMDKKGWTAEVNKMIHVMGAPISEQDAQAIISYLAENYGKK